jgi:hypothetical protein
MKIKTLSTALSLSLGTAIALTWGQLAKAQSVPGTEGSESGDRNSLYGGDGFINPMDLIQKATLAPSRTVEEFDSESDKSLSNAAAEFKRQREQMLNSIQIKPSSQEETKSN